MTQTTKTRAKHIYTVRVFTRYGWNDLGEYDTKVGAKRAMEQLRASVYPHSCMRIEVVE